MSLFEYTKFRDTKNFKSMILLTLSENRGSTLISLDSVFFLSCNIVSICIRWASNDDVCIVANDSGRDELGTDRITMHYTSSTF